MRRHRRRSGRLLRGGVEQRGVFRQYRGEVPQPGVFSDVVARDESHVGHGVSSPAGRFGLFFACFLDKWAFFGPEMTYSSVVF